MSFLTAGFDAAYKSFGTVARVAWVATLASLLFVYISHSIDSSTNNQVWGLPCNGTVHPAWVMQNGTMPWDNGYSIAGFFFFIVGSALLVSSALSSLMYYTLQWTPEAAYLPDAFVQFETAILGISLSFAIQEGGSTWGQCYYSGQNSSLIAGSIMYAVHLFCWFGVMGWYNGFWKYDVVMVTNGWFYLYLVGQVLFLAIAMLISNQAFFLTALNGNVAPNWTVNSSPDGLMANGISFMVTGIISICFGAVFSLSSYFLGFTLFGVVLEW
jgi:hypothetical protein